MKTYKLSIAAAPALAASLPAGAAGAKERTDAFMRNEMATGKLEKMSVAFEQLGETRYAFREGPGSEEPMHVASITKTVTAVLLMQLAEEGRLWLRAVFLRPQLLRGAEPLRRDGLQFPGRPGPRRRRGRARRGTRPPQARNRGPWRKLTAAAAVEGRGGLW